MQRTTTTARAGAGAVAAVEPVPEPPAPNHAPANAAVKGYRKAEAGEAQAVHVAGGNRGVDQPYPRGRYPGAQSCGGPRKSERATHGRGDCAGAADAGGVDPGIGHAGVTWREEIIEGDCRAVLADLPADSIEACLTHPPYHLTANKKGGSGEASVNLSTRTRPGAHCHSVSCRKNGMAAVCGSSLHMARGVARASPGRVPAGVRRHAHLSPAGLRHRGRGVRIRDSVRGFMGRGSQSRAI